MSTESLESQPMSPLSGQVFRIEMLRFAVQYEKAVFLAERCEGDINIAPTAKEGETRGKAHHFGCGRIEADSHKRRLGPELPFRQDYSTFRHGENRANGVKACVPAFSVHCERLSLSVLVFSRPVIKTSSVSRARCRRA